MIQRKLRQTRAFIDPRFPREQRILINPDGVEAADYIDNMTEHLGHIIKIALESIGDDAVRNEIKHHAYQAIKGANNGCKSSSILAGTRRHLVQEMA